MERYQDFARDVATADPLSQATITVYDAGTLNLASIFSDDLSTPTPKTNPFTADVTTGYFFFYAANGPYDVKVSKPGFTTYTLSDIQLGRFTSLQGLVSDAITLQFGSSGTDLNITTPTASAIQLNVPDASATARGVIGTGAQTLNGPFTLTNPLDLDSGGTGLNITPTNGQLLVGRTSDNTLQLATITGTSNQIVVTNGAASITLSTPQNIDTAATPTFAGLTLSGLTASTALVSNGSKAITSVALTNGQLLIGSTGSTPVAAALTAGSGITITNGAGSIQIASSVAAITSLNGLTTSAQTFAIPGTSGTSPNWSSSGAVHTLNIPHASSANTGLINTSAQDIAGEKTFLTPPVGVPTFSRCDTTLTKNANTTLENVSGLAFAVGANEVWAFQFHLRGVSSTAARFKFTLTGPSSPTAVWFGVMSSENGPTAQSATAFASTVTSGGNTVDTDLILHGLVRNGANAGTVQLQFAQNTSDASDSKIYAESYVIAWRIS